MNDPHQPTRPSAATATRHFQITPNDSVDLTQSPQALYCSTAGNLVVIDRAGVSLTYAVQAGQVLPFTPARIGTATTCVVYGWL